MLAERSEGITRRAIIVPSPSWAMCSHPRYKYELTAAYNHIMRGRRALLNRAAIKTGGRVWATLYPDGLLHIADRYAWDGASGAVDTMSFTRGSLIHDVLYQMIAVGELPRSWIKVADAELYRIVREDGMPRWRAWYVWAAVRAGGHAREKYQP